jgi:hypothetical protein
MKAVGLWRYSSNILDLGLVIDGSEQSASRPGYFTPLNRRKSLLYPLDRKVDPRAGLEIVEKTTIVPLPGIETRTMLSVLRL